MRRDHALLKLKPHVTDDLVVAVYQTCFDWLALNPRALNYVATGVMGQASSHGLGLALASPERRVLVFDGDGSLLMNLGSLVTIAAVGPDNLYHFVFVNGMYEVNGEHPIPGRDNVDFAALARAAGYRYAERVSELGQLDAMLDYLFGLSGPALLALDVEPGASYPRCYDYIHSAEARESFRRALGQDRVGTSR